MTDIALMGDALSIWLDVKARGRTYRGEIRHRVPVIPTATRHGLLRTFPYHLDLLSTDGRPCPTAAALLVQTRVETLYREAVDESDGLTVEAIVEEIIEAHKASLDVEALGNALYLVKNAITALGK